MTRVELNAVLLYHKAHLYNAHDGIRVNLTDVNIDSVELECVNVTQMNVDAIPIQGVIK